jgi:hypothetical protein
VFYHALLLISPDRTPNKKLIVSRIHVRSLMMNKDKSDRNKANGYTLAERAPARHMKRHDHGPRLYDTRAKLILDCHESIAKYW